MEAISLFSSSPYIHCITHKVADKLCLAMLKQNAYIIRDIYFGCVVNRKKKELQIS